jgi:membrane protease YdiL (CAAX protease family)
MEYKINFAVEPLIIYLILFLPGFPSTGSPGEEIYQFTVYRELDRILGYSIPSLLLLWYLSYINGKKIFPMRVRSADFQSMVIALPGLLGIGLGISVLSSIISGPDTTGMVVEAPGGIAAWILMVFSCFCTGYLEETYFRHYLLGRFWEYMTIPPLPDSPKTAPVPDRFSLKNRIHSLALGLRASPAQAGSFDTLRARLAPAPGILVSVALFSLCHIYEGPWGVTNAAFAGLLLSLIYRHYGALHGLAWAHGLYNVFIYANGA